MRLFGFVTEWVLGIDAANLLLGGGRTHLVELLRAAQPGRHGFSRVVAWGSPETLALLDDRPWLEKVAPPALSARLHRRAGWQHFALDRAARKAGCSLLFVPGGSYTGHFQPVVLMSQNLLPFEPRELLRFGASLRTAKLAVLRAVQSWSFQRCHGLIFLTDYAQQAVQRVVAQLPRSIVIPHGLSDRFRSAPRPQHPISTFSSEAPFRVLYVSIVDQYKHQWHVVDAVARLRRLTGWNLALDLVGPAYPQALPRLQRSIAAHDPQGHWLRYHGAVPYPELHAIYARSDLALWASSCETFGLILLEAMGAGLPVASSDSPPMREVLADTGLYFNPEDPQSIATTLQRLIASPELRASLAAAAHRRAQSFTWERCADATFAFLASVLRASERSQSAPSPAIRQRLA